MKYTRPSANILLEAAEIQEKKGADYNGAKTSVTQADYYTYGVWSILDTVHAKYLRMMSVLENMEQGVSANYESVEDSALDLINYASFIVAYMRGEVPGQTSSRTIFNTPVGDDTKPSLIPVKFRPITVDVNTVTSTSAFPGMVGYLTNNPISLTTTGSL